MANHDIITRMNSVLDDYEAGELRASDVERLMRGHIEALEALPYNRIKEADHLCYRLVTANEWLDDEEFINEETVVAVVAEFRSFLASLPK